MVHGGQGQGLLALKGAAVGVEGDLVLLQLHPVGQGQLVVRSAQEGGVQGAHQVTGGDEQLRAVLKGEGHAVQVFRTHVLQVAEGSPVQAAPQDVVGHVPVVKAGDVLLEPQGGVLQLAPGLVGRVLVVQNGLDGALGQVELHHAAALVHAVGGGHGAVVLGSGGGVILIAVLVVVLVVAQVIVLVVVLVAVVVLQSLDGRQGLLLLGCQRGGGQGAQAQGKGHRGDRCVFLKVCHGSFSFKSQNLRMKSLAAGLA